MATESYVRVAPDSIGKQVRALLIGGGPASGTEQQVVCLADADGNLVRTWNTDAFGRLRISDPVTLFESKQLFDKQPLFWDEALTGAGSATYSQPNAQTTMTVVGGTDSVIRQTRMWFPYQPGKSQLVLMTGVFSKQANVRKRVGLYDGTDGIYLEVTGTAATWCIAKGGVQTEAVPQASWNGDKLDGTGPSGLILDLAAGQIMWFDYEWLGVGAVRAGFVVDGKFIVTHTFRHSNNPVFTTVYMGKPNLPVRYEIVSQGGAGTMQHICSTVISEGGLEQHGVGYYVHTPIATGVTLPNATMCVVLALRLKAGFAGAQVTPKSLRMLTVGNNNVEWRLILNPTISGAALVWVSVPNSAVEYAVGVTANGVSGGTEMGGGYIPPASHEDTQEIASALRLGAGISGTRDILVVAGAGHAANQSLQAGLEYIEQI